MRRPLSRFVMHSLAIAGLLLGMGRSVLADTLGDAVHGKSLYEAKCGGCHSVDSNRIGPMHRNVIGRAPGSVAGYDYSPALKKLGGVWTSARIDRWLQGPQEMAPGTKMFMTVASSQDRADIIAALVSVSSHTQ
jgi:cytochrome c